MAQDRSGNDLSNVVGYARIFTLVNAIRDRLIDTPAIQQPYLDLLVHHQAQQSPPTLNTVKGYFWHHWPRIRLRHLKDSWGQTKKADPTFITIRHVIVEGIIANRGWGNGQHINEVEVFLIAVVLHELAHSIIGWWTGGRTIKGSPTGLESGLYVERRVFGGGLTSFNRYRVRDPWIGVGYWNRHRPGKWVIPPHRAIILVNSWTQPGFGHGQGLPLLDAQALTFQR